jgi:hypothetical protein
VKPEVKAALLSGLMFPGLGQMYLKRYLRGLILMMLAFLGIAAIVAVAVAGALESLKALSLEGGTADLNALANLAAASSKSRDIYINAGYLLIACCWVFSVIDAYIIGKSGHLDQEKR